MEPDVKQLVEENLRLSKENNELLLKIYNIQKWSQIIRIGYYVVIVLIGIGAFYFIKPFLSNLGGLSNIGGIMGAYGLDSSNLDSFIK
jgi:hypothetical protein